MIVGCFYQKLPTGTMSAIPIFLNADLEVVGFSEIDHDEMKFVITWGMSDGQDFPSIVYATNGPDFLSMYGNKYYPKKGTPIPGVIELGLFPGFEKVYTQSDLISALRKSHDQQVEYWRDLKAEISSLTYDQKDSIIQAYRHYGGAKFAAINLGIDRQLVKQVVLMETGEYAWE